MISLPNCYAHTLAGKSRDEWQPLDLHLNSVASIASDYARPFQSDCWAHVAGWLHDLGKAHPQFQAYLARANGLEASEHDASVWGGRVNHSGAGAVLAVEHWPGIAGKTLAYVTAGHHAGLADWNSADSGAGALCVRLESEKPTADEVRDKLRQSIRNLSPVLSPPPFLKPAGYHLWVRMLFSCLVDADFLDTEAFMDKGRAESRPGFPALGRLKTSFDAALGRLVRESPKTLVNNIRQEVLTACRIAAEWPPGFFSLTVPTGGGKTLSSTAFALDHAIRYGKRRVIYVIPYTSIIEQTADVLRRFLGEDNVVEHHTNLSPDKETLRLALACENWNAPVIVTTNVQFFESLYAASPGSCRKLHNIIESVVILDEAQLLPPERLIPCVDALCHLTRDYGVSVVLSTATQPAIPDPLKPVCAGEPTPLLQAREIIPDPASLYDRLARTRISFPSDLEAQCDWTSLAAELCRHRQVLCIVNRRQDCRELHRLMPPGTIHLSALMCGEHRSKVIADIKERLCSDGDVRVISTQLVEAGVDLDFPVVYRALAGLDSIAQAAGRCNREGKLNRLAEVVVFVPPRPSPPGLLRKGEDTTRELAMLPGFCPNRPASYTRYFDLYYSKVNDMGGKWLEDRLTRHMPDVDFRTAADEFRLIRDLSVPVIVRYAESPTLIERLRFSGPVREVMRRLQRFTVNVNRRVAERLRDSALIEEIHPGILAQTRPGLYDTTTGLDIFSAGFPPEELVL
ncbi:MAG TPA: CRISPR-associated endonuclease Cas3'' [Phycisphaerae bacterium]|nr:CRISPR-associated endonuclease Cas3'' [Phycisphaerae bacterium]